MSSKVQYHVTKDSIHLSFNGKHVSVGRGDRKFAEIRDLIKEDRVDEIVDVFNRKEQKLEEYVEGSGFTLKNGRVVDSDGVELPNVLNDRLRELKEEGFAVTYLVNFWNNLKQNPSYRSREQLFKFLEHNGHPLTDDGHFIAYRGCTSDFKDKHSRTFDNSPGSICTMDRHEVDDDPNRTCSRGLHVAAFTYAKNWAGRDGKLLKVKVNPRDVVSVPVDYNGEKMRTCRFEVLEECSEIIDGVVDGHTYTYRGCDDWGDVWDYDDEEDESYSEDDVETVLFLARAYQGRYKDRVTLASRIEEEFDEDRERSDYDLTLTLILEILNDNEDDWLDS